MLQVYRCDPLKTVNANLHTIIKTNFEEIFGCGYFCFCWETVPKFCTAVFQTFLRKSLFGFVRAKSVLLFLKL